MPISRDSPKHRADPDGPVSLVAPRAGDLANILAISAEQWGAEGRRRYTALLAAAMRRAGAEPTGMPTRDRGELSPSVRSLHIRHARPGTRRPKVGNPVHILYYRVVAPDLIEIIRVLHDRMEPSRHLPPSDQTPE